MNPEALSPPWWIAPFRPALIWWSLPWALAEAYTVALLKPDEPRAPGGDPLREGAQLPVPRTHQRAKDHELFA